MDRKIIDDSIELTSGISGRDILTPLDEEEIDLVPLPEIEYKIVEGNTMDKLIRDVNAHLKNGRQTEGGVQVVSGQTTRFYQSMIRWNVDLDEKPEMPSQNSEAGTMGPKPLDIPGLEDEPDLYEDVE